MLAISRRVGIVPVGIRVSDPSVPAVDHEFQMLPLGGHPSCIFRFVLGLVNRRGAFRSLASDGPTVGMRYYVDVLFVAHEPMVGLQSGQMMSDHRGAPAAAF